LKSWFCAKAASGHATATPPISVKKSRRFIAPPRLRTGHRTGSNQRKERGGRCPLWVISGHSVMSAVCPLYPRERTSAGASRMSAKCQ
jgi:hypothetical protein